LFADNDCFASKVKQLAHYASFPNKYTTQVLSPNRFFGVIFDKDNNGLFFMKDGKKDELLCAVNRSVDVLWSPNSRAFAITNYEGSCLTRAQLYKVSDTTHPVDIEKKIKASARDSILLKALKSNIDHHVIVIQWLSPNSMEIRITCRNVPPSEKKMTIYDLSYIWNYKTGSSKRIPTPRSEWDFPDIDCKRYE